MISQLSVWAAKIWHDHHQGQVDDDDDGDDDDDDGDDDDGDDDDGDDDGDGENDYQWRNIWRESSCVWRHRFPALLMIMIALL